MVHQHIYNANVNEMLLWDMIKLKQDPLLSTFVKKRNKKLKSKETILEDEINQLEEKLVKEYEKETLEEPNTKRNEIENLIEYHTKGAILGGN